MISDDRIRELIRDAELDWHKGYSPNCEGNRYQALARAIEREAIAEPVRLMTEWREAKDAVLNWQNRNVMYRPSVLMLQPVAAAEQAIRDYLERMSART